VNVATALWGGIVGMLALVVVYLGFLALRLTRFDFVRFWGRLVSGERSSLAYTYGVIVLLVLGALIGLLYRLAFQQIDSATYVGWGALLGLAHGVLMLLVLPLLGLADRSVRDGTLQRPGLAVMAYGRLTPIAILAVHVVYGVWVGSFLMPA
jgi:hypothetical protein